MDATATVAAVKAALEHGAGAADVDRAAVDRAVAALALAEGLAPDAVLALVTALVRRGAVPDGSLPRGFATWRDGVTRRVLRAAVPRAAVPEEAAVLVLGCLNSQEHSVVFKGLVLKWLVLVWDRLDDVRRLVQLYGVLFHYLEYESLRPLLCQLLYRLTTHEHVKLFRCNKLMDLYHRVGAEPALMNLLAIYKLHQPQWVAVKVAPVGGARRMGTLGRKTPRLPPPPPGQQPQQHAAPAEEDPGMFDRSLASYLKTWNGHAHAEHVFALLAKIRPRAFEDLYTDFFAPLQRLFLLSDVAWKCRLVGTYARVVGYWALFDWKTHFARSKERTHAALQGIPDDVDHFKTLYELVSHVDRLLVSAFQLEQGHVALEHAALSFYEQVCVLHPSHGIPFVAIPSASVVQHCLLSSTAMAVSRLCGMVAQYKAAYDTLKRDNKNNAVAIEFEGYSGAGLLNGLERVREFNVFILDISSALWRMKLPGGGDETLLFEALSCDALAACNERMYALSLVHSSAFAGFTRRFIESLGGDVAQLREAPEMLQPGPFRPRALGLSVANYAELRVKLLAFLKAEGLAGVHEFMHTFIQSLVKLQVSQGAV